MKNKDVLIGLGLFGVSTLYIGAVIGGTIVNKINKRYHYNGLGIWKATTEFFQGQLTDAYERIDELEKRLEEKA